MTRPRLPRLVGFGSLALALALAAGLALDARAQQAANGSCNSAIGHRQVVNERAVGPEQCVIQEEQAIANAYGVAYRRVEIALDGTLAGYVARSGPRTEMFTDAPEFTLAQRGNDGERFHGIASYQGAKGSGMTVFYPASPADWNGVLYVTAHGAGSYAPVGELLPRLPGGFAPLMGANSYVGLMVDKGYAVAYTRRSATRSAADDEQAVLDDGTHIGGLSFAYHTGLLRDYALLARNFVTQRLGAAPARTYFYGHSAGGAWGRLANYVPGANADETGRRLFDGFLLDDAGGGYYLPQLLVDGRDVLFTTAEERARLAPQIDVLHLLDQGEDEGSVPIKRENARLLLQKGLGDRTRSYEIAGSSHFDAGRVSAAGQPEFVSQNLDLGGVFDALLDVLDAWVARGVAPPPTRSDSFLLGDADGDGVRESPAVALPEVACPTGVYFPHPEGAQPFRLAGQITGFAAYDGASMEPLDGRGYLVDMNHDGVRDRRETISVAWQRRLAEGERTGRLARGERITPEQYVSCVEEVASELAAEGLLSRAARDYYVEQARATPVGRAAW